MPWVAVRFDLDARWAEAASDTLLQHGALSVDVSDAQADTPGEHPLFGEPGCDAPGLWHHSRINALFDASLPAESIVMKALAAAGLTSCPALDTSTVGEQDWVRATQRQFGPLQIAPGLWVVPTWSDPPDPEAINLRLDPGLAFGTGGHATTRQCLRWLAGHRVAGMSVLDYGCGSGILAIAAKRLGAGRVLGTDLDMAALRTSRANATENDVEVLFATPDRIPAGPYDTVFANILSGPLMALAPLLTAYVRPGGALVLAGILESQADAVVAAYRPAVDLRVEARDEGWTCLAGTRTQVASAP